MTQLTPEVREALEGTRDIAYEALTLAEERRDKYVALANEANDEAIAQESIVNAISAVLAGPRPVDGDKYKTFGE